MPNLLGVPRCFTVHAAFASLASSAFVHLPFRMSPVCSLPVCAIWPSPRIASALCSTQTLRFGISSSLPREGVLADSTQLHEVSPVSGFSLRPSVCTRFIFFPSSIRPLFSMIDVLRSWWGRVLCPGILLGILLGASGISCRYL